MRSSCFDCIHLKDPPDPDRKNHAYWCEVFRELLTYNEAKTPNDCPKKEQYAPGVDLLEFPQAEILLNLLNACVDLAEYLERPFTVKELADHTSYGNKNSLWMLLETLVNTGKLEKLEITTQDNNGQRFQANIYWPMEWGQTSGNSTKRSESA